MKFNIDNYKGRYAMHCKTYDEAVDFCNYLHSTGRGWISGRSYYEYTNWEKYKTKTIYYFNEGSYCEIDLVNQDYTVLEWGDFMSNIMSNKDRINKVFVILGVEPNDIFKIKGQQNRKAEYYFDNNLELHCILLGDDFKLDGEKSNKMVIDILRGDLIVQTIIAPTKDEQLAIDYAKTCGYKWLAKDKNDTVYAYKEKPIKQSTSWFGVGYSGYILKIGLPISFLSWEDEAPYYIGD